LTYLGFLTEGKSCCYIHHTFLLGFPTGYALAIKRFSGAVAGEHRRIISLVNWAPPNSNRQLKSKEHLRHPFAAPRCHYKREQVLYNPKERKNSEIVEPAEILMMP
jgi:hypothetical protein